MGRAYFPRVVQRRAGLVLAILVVPALAGHPAAAQDADPGAVVEPVDRAIVSGGTLSAGEGRIAVNIASGAGNQQAAAAIVANGVSALASGILIQHQDNPASGDRTTHAVIEDGAFAGSRGLISINIVAGSQNQEANLAVIATGMEGLRVTDATLAQTRASNEPSGGLVPSAPNDVATLSDGAFTGSEGLVQVNLIGGERNSSANLFALNVSAGGNP